MQTNLKALAELLIPLIDLTNLDEQADNEAITQLCQKAKQAGVAAVCVYPQFGRLAVNLLTSSPILVATVANFPKGNASFQLTEAEILTAIAADVDEIDVVLPYEQYLYGDKHYAIDFIKQCKAICGSDVALKVILETGALKDPDIIHTASLEIIRAGANFIKTSTGKQIPGADLTSAKAMLTAIKESQAEGYHCGFKASGGIRTPEDALGYIQLAEAIMGKDWLSPQTMRFGASQLLDRLL